MFSTSSIVTEKGIRDHVRNLIVMCLVMQAKLLIVALAVRWIRIRELDQDTLSFVAMGGCNLEKIETTKL